MLKQADGTMPGHQQNPDYGVAPVDPPVNYTHEISIVQAERDRLVDLLDRLESIIPHGYMVPEHQAVWREAKATLAEYNRRPKNAPSAWVDRGAK